LAGSTFFFLVMTLSFRQIALLYLEPIALFGARALLICLKRCFFVMVLNFEQVGLFLCSLSLSLTHTNPSLLVSSFYYYDNYYYIKIIIIITSMSSSYHYYYHYYY